MANNTSLSERQRMMLSHIVTTSLQDSNTMVETLKDVRGKLQTLGATNEDIQTIQNYITTLAEAVKDNNRVGEW